MRTPEGKDGSFPFRLSADSLGALKTTALRREGTFDQRRTWERPEYGESWRGEWGADILYLRALPSGCCLLAPLAPSCYLSPFPSSSSLPSISSPRLLPSPSSQTLPLQVWEAAKELDCQGIIGPTISFDFFFFLLNSSKSLKGIL